MKLPISLKDWGAIMLYLLTGSYLWARYEGFKVAAGDYILMLDSDQILEKSYN